MTNDFSPAGAGGQSRRFSKEEYAKMKREEKDAVFRAADETAERIVKDPETFQTFLDTQSRLDRYSAVNALLIFKQKPEASKLKDFDAWNKDRAKIKKGEKSISILEPVEYEKRDGTTGLSFNVKKVFDVSQTTMRQEAFKRPVRDIKELADVMLEASPVEVRWSDEMPDSGIGAFYDNNLEILFVKRDQEGSTKTLHHIAKELGHAELSMENEHYDRRDMNFQAECIGYMLLKKYGADTKDLTVERLPEKLTEKDAKGIRSFLTKTRNAMADLNDRISDALYQKRQERSQSYER